MLVGGYEDQDTCPPIAHNSLAPTFAAEQTSSMQRPLLLGSPRPWLLRLTGYPRAALAAAVGALTAAIAAPVLEVVAVPQLASVSPHAGVPPPSSYTNRRRLHHWMESRGGCSQRMCLCCRKSTRPHLWGRPRLHLDCQIPL